MAPVQVRSELPHLRSGTPRYPATSSIDLEFAPSLTTCWKQASVAEALIAKGNDADLWVDKGNLVARGANTDLSGKADTVTLESFHRGIEVVDPKPDVIQVRDPNLSNMLNL